MQNKIKATLVLMIILSYTHAGCGPSKNGKYTTPFPATQNISHNNTFACEALIDSDFTGSPEKHLTNGIEATVSKGTNKVSLQIKDQKTLQIKKHYYFYQELLLMLVMQVEFLFQ